MFASLTGLNEFRRTIPRNLVEVKVFLISLHLSGSTPFSSAYFLVLYCNFYGSLLIFLLDIVAETMICKRYVRAN